jgi:hypothetical protein
MTKTCKSTQPNLSKIDIDELLRQRRQVAVIWSIEDVLQERPDLTADQAWEVLQVCREEHDCKLGFTWTFIRDVADELFPTADE